MKRRVMKYLISRIADNDNQYRFNSIALLTTVGILTRRPDPGDPFWFTQFYESGYLGMVKHIGLNVIARQVAVYSNSTWRTNPLLQWDEEYIESGILAMAEVELYGIRIGTNEGA